MTSQPTKSRFHEPVETEVTQYRAIEPMAVLALISPINGLKKTNTFQASGIARRRIQPLIQSAITRLLNLPLTTLVRAGSM